MTASASPEEPVTDVPMTDVKDDLPAASGLQEDQASVTTAEEPVKEKEGSDAGSEEETDMYVSVAKATSFKECGNGALKGGLLDEAVDEYKKGIKLLRKTVLEEKADFDEPPFTDARAVVLSLCLNLAMVQLKRSEFGSARDAAKDALKLDTKSEKATFRLASAELGLGEVEAAKDTFRKVVEINPQNRDARAQLQVCVDKLREARAAEKERCAALFAKGPLYADRAREQQMREAEWKRSNEKRVEEGLEEQSFEDWSAAMKKEKEEAEKKEKKEREEREEEERKRREKEEPRKPAKSEVITDDGIELDEEERKLLAETKKKGYCYFRNEEDPNIILPEQHRPKKIDDAAAVESPEKQVGSAWNQGGTWEETDRSQWCKDRLQAALQNVEVGMVRTKKVGTISGDASVAVVRNTKKFLLDLKGDVSFELKVDESKYRGKLYISELTDSIVSVSAASFKDSRPPNSPEYDAAVAAYRERVLATINEFKADFHATF